MQEDSGSDSMNTNAITEEVRCLGCISSRVRMHVHKLYSKTLPDTWPSKHPYNFYLSFTHLRNDLFDSHVSID